jgi:hypothetical protein
MIAVLTCQRPVSHLADTIRGIDASATERNRVVVVDGESVDDVPPHWSVKFAPKPAWDYKIHNRFPFWACLELAVDAGEDLLFFEDDVTFCVNAVRYAEQFVVPDGLALVSKIAPLGDMPPGGPHVAVHDIKHFAFLQGAKIPLRTCQSLMIARGEMQASRLGGSDTCVGIIGHRRGWKYGVHWPSIVQHVGDYSVVSQCHNPGRIARSFDASLDALTLPLAPELRV